MWHRWSLHRASWKMTFHSVPARIHLSSGHLCAETMTVWVACSAHVPRWTGALSGHPPPRASHSASQASPPPSPPAAPTYVFVRQGQGTKCWVIPIKLSLAGSGCRCYCFCVWFCLPALSLFFSPPPSPGSCQCWLPGRLVCVFLRSWKNVACEREVEALASATCELRFFSF